MGRIGRTLVRLIADQPALQLVAVNDLMEPENLEYLLRFDSVYGRSDIIGDPRASIIDLELTRVIGGDLLKLMSWYDNEWGYANQLVREALSLTGAGLPPRYGSVPQAE
jgi:glyceraldehyde-3-phosphate dehydrogenase/erythrose-4-phosphate dehydrogenase